MNALQPILEKAFVQALDSAPVGVTVSDPCGRILFTNPAEASMHGWNVKDLLGKPARVFHPPWAERRRGPGALSEVRKWTRERVNCRKDGTTFPVRLNSSVVLGDGGEPEALVTISEDRSEGSVTRRPVPPGPRAGATLAGEWALGVAHDFNNILTVLGCTVEVMVDCPDRGERDKRAKLALEQVQRGRGLVGWLQDVSRAREPELQPLDIANVVDGFASVLDRLLPAAVNLKVRHDAPLPPVLADSVLVQEALLNLVTNARDAMPDGGTVTILTSGHVVGRQAAVGEPPPPPSHVSVTVADTGGGIEATERVHLFDPFYTTKRRGRGTGLGLGFVKSIMERLGGQVHLESAPGRGTRVFLTFPTHPAKDAGQRSSR